MYSYSKKCLSRIKKHQQIMLFWIQGTYLFLFLSFFYHCRTRLKDQQNNGPWAKLQHTIYFCKLSCIRTQSCPISYMWFVAGCFCTTAEVSSCKTWPKILTIWCYTKTNKQNKTKKPLLTLAAEYMFQQNIKIAMSKNSLALILFWIVEQPVSSVTFLKEKKKTCSLMKHPFS